MNTLVETLKYFVFITFELIALFLLISAAVEIILMYIPQDKIRQWLSGRGILGNVMAAGFGALTPFCACSVLGIPLYIRAETAIPIGVALMAKGMSIGTVIALVIGGAGMAIPEMTMLASIFRKKLVIMIIAVTFLTAVIAGYLFNVLL